MRFMQSKNKNVYACIFSEFTHILKNLQYPKSTMGYQARQAGRLVRWPRPVSGRRKGSTTNLTVLSLTLILSQSLQVNKIRKESKELGILEQGYNPST